MRITLADQWQLSPLTDLSIPQNDIILPASLSKALPHSLSEEEISQQEWHLMHDFEVGEHYLTLGAIDLVVQGIYQYAEIRINGRGIIDCDGSGERETKDALSYLQPGFNRIELLFLEQEEFFEEQGDQQEQEDQSSNFLALTSDGSESKPLLGLGVGTVPYLQFLQHLRVEKIKVEQIWHSVGGCEVLVSLSFKVFNSGLVSASISFDGVRLQVPIDMRSEQATALFQLDAPRLCSFEPNEEQVVNLLKVEIDGQVFEFTAKLHPMFESQTIQLF
jgi:hypothetical protein